MQFVEAHGARIPAIGLGTMTIKDQLCVDTVAQALRLGYRHLDTAQMYGNEREVGEGLRTSGITREDVFLTTKVWFDKLAEADFRPSVEESLKKLGLAQIDLLLIHWNNAQIPLSESVGELCRAKKDGLTKHVGVANFTVALLDEALKVTTEPLVTNQIEVHPFIEQTKILVACKQHGVSVTAYCPIARGSAKGNDVLDRIGKAHKKSAAQVSLRWLVQQGLIPIPRTSNPQHLADNLNVFDFKLSDAEMKEIAALGRPEGRVVKPPHAPQWDV